ncbi:transcription factor AP-4 [Phlebotomus papatasi]|uniref:transcription factor AP-4 n=1 Tax=Phlebotomus papatasi TaxID=29031 RepID=UPI002483D535|nr:transcription factor AP-4 [Phlebotomus papatasi]
MSIVGNKSEEFVVVETLQKSDEKFIITQEDGGGGGHHNTTTTTMIDNDKKMRRQIANSNERRRMQSINAGFQSLRLLLPHHEGEKLSKAAILQQTAEFVFNLEQDKNRLMSNVSYLRELLLKNNINPDLPTVSVSSTGTTATTSTVSGKKRKLDNVMTMQTISDSSDEGLGSMSPEPLTFVTVMTKPSGAITTTTSASAASTNSILAKEVVDLKHQLEIERRQRMMLEDQLRQLECQVYPERLSREERIYQHQEVIEHTDNLRVDDVDMVDGPEDGVEVVEEEDDEDESTTISLLPEDSMTKVSLSQLQLHQTHDLQDMQVVSLDSLPATGQNVVVCSPVEEISIEETRVVSPSRVVVEKVEEVVEKAEISTKQRLQPILEAVIKAEPKVEVERISNSPVSLTVVKSEDSAAAQSRMYVTSTSRQNLETIVEAIRHLEGDHLFGETTQEQPTQEAPLALTTHNKQSHLQPLQHARKIHVDVNPFLHFRTPTTATAQHLQQQCRPGVIVVKQNS